MNSNGLRWCPVDCGRTLLESDNILSDVRQVFRDLLEKLVKSPVKLWQVRWASDVKISDSQDLPDSMIYLSDSLILTKSDRSPRKFGLSPVGLFKLFKRQFNLGYHRSPIGVEVRLGLQIKALSPRIVKISPRIVSDVWRILSVVRRSPIGSDRSPVGLRWTVEWPITW